MLAKITAPFTENSAGFVDVNQSAETHESLEKSIRRGRKENSVQFGVAYLTMRKSCNLSKLKLNIQLV